jgi:hypothetical protein
VKTAIEDTLFGVLKARREVLVACWGTKIRAAMDAPLTTAELLDRMPAFLAGKPKAYIEDVKAAGLLK